jgi:hypothetical protein
LERRWVEKNVDWGTQGSRSLKQKLEKGREEERKRKKNR